MFEFDWDSFSVIEKLDEALFLVENESVNEQQNLISEYPTVTASFRGQVERHIDKGRQIRGLYMLRYFPKTIN